MSNFLLYKTISLQACCKVRNQSPVIKFKFRNYENSWAKQIKFIIHCNTKTYE